MRRNPASTLSGLPIENARASGQEKPEERETTAARAAACESQNQNQPVEGRKPTCTDSLQDCTDLSQPETAVVETLTALGVARPVAIDDARRAPAEAVAVLAIVLAIVKRGGIRNPPGLARAALRDPARYLPADTASPTLSGSNRVYHQPPLPRPAPTPDDEPLPPEPSEHASELEVNAWIALCNRKLAPKRTGTSVS